MSGGRLEGRPLGRLLTIIRDADKTIVSSTFLPFPWVKDPAPAKCRGFSLKSFEKRKSMIKWRKCVFLSVELLDKNN